MIIFLKGRESNLWIHGSFDPYLLYQERSQDEGERNGKREHQPQGPGGVPQGGLHRGQ